MTGFVGSYVLSVALSRPDVSAVRTSVNASVGSAQVELTVSGLVSWVNSHSIQIVDSHGKVHDISIEPSTQIINESAKTLTTLDIIRTNSYSRIEAIKDENGLRAVQVFVR